MKRTLIALFLFIAISAHAQQATINSPVARSSETRILIVDFQVKRDCACANIVVEFQDASSVAIRQVRYDVPDPAIPAATLVGLITAMETVRSTETGTVIRKMNFRVLGWLSDNTYLPAGTTLVP